MKKTQALHFSLFVLVITLLVQCQREPFHFSIQPIEGTVDTIEGRIHINSPSVYEDPNNFVWGGSVIKGDDGMYHLLYSTWEAGPDLPKFGDSWVLSSKIAYAVSKYPDRDFKFQKMILKGRIHEGDSSAWDAQCVHNPHIKKFNGKYYLYYIGSHDPGVQPEGTPGAKLSKRNRIQQVQQMGVIEFKSFQDLLAGNFNRPDRPILSPRTRVKKDNVIDPSPQGTEPKPDNIIVVNPSVVYRPADKKYLLYFKGNLYDPHWRGVHGVAIADSPTGPFKALDKFVFDIRTSDGKIANAEDPYVWYSKRDKRFYAIVKDFTGKVTGLKPGLAVLQSLDGEKWENLENPFYLKKEVPFTDGRTLKVSHLERPQLLLDDNGESQALFSACSIEPAGNKKDGTTFNIHFRLKK